MKELLETEEQYIKHLEHICTVSSQTATKYTLQCSSLQHYMPSMDSASQLPKCLVGKRHVLFGYLPSILEFNRE